MTYRQAEFRAPTQEEISQVKRYVQRDVYTEHLSELLDTACLVVFPHYQTDCPGYCGKVLVALYGGSPDCVETFCWIDNKVVSGPNA